LEGGDAIQGDLNSLIFFSHGVNRLQMAEAQICEASLGRQWIGIV
jgi:hypothetical protein